ncbi:MAG: hypothetical protein KA885_04775 [Spirochaetes bacterium]|nr:hypothetical protein [Spirochaetota bacterium]
MVKTNYLFHFIVSKTIDKSINHLKKSLNLESNRELIEYLFEVISKNIHFIKGIIGDHKSEYEFIDCKDYSRIDKYVRLKSEKYKMLKKLHYKYNEYGMSMILRDIIKFFYEGIVKYGAKEFICMIGKKLNTNKITKDLGDILTHMKQISLKKLALLSMIIQNLPVYV